MLEIQFKGVREDIRALQHSIEKQDKLYDARFSKLEQDILDLKTDNARYKVILAIGATIASIIGSVIINRIL